MKRFYKSVAYTADANSVGYSIVLDGKSIRTPGGETLVAANEALAQAVCREWEAQGDEINPQSMPLTQFLNTQIDRLENERAAWQAQSLSYLQTDLLCYRADQPEALVKLQEMTWDKWLDWFETYSGRERLPTTTVLSEITLPEGLHAHMDAHLSQLPPHSFTVLSYLTGLCGSLVLSLAFIEGKLDAEELFETAFLEEEFYSRLANEDHHGRAPHVELARKVVLEELNASREYLSIAA